MPRKQPPTKTERAKPQIRKVTPREAAILKRIDSRIDRKAKQSWTWLARGCGLSDNMGSQWSSGNSFPPERHLHTIAQMLGVDMGWLLTGDERSEATQAQTHTEAAMLAVLRELPPDMQRMLLAQAEAARDSAKKN